MVSAIEQSTNTGNAAETSDFGVVYLAFGRPFLAMALNSFKSLRKTNPKLPVLIVTNVCDCPPMLDFWNSEIDHWQFIDQPTKDNRLIKTSIYKYTPFQKTLYLDCDTVVLSDISRMSFFLDYFDIVLRLSMTSGGKLDREKELFSKTVAFHELPHWNGGVFGFRKNEHAEHFFELWAEKYLALGHKRDQPSLVETVFESTCRILSVSGRWNTGDNLYAPAKLRNETKIWHYKTDIDSTLKRELLEADTLIGCTNNDETMAYLSKRSGDEGSFAFSNVFKSLVRMFRGRLPKLAD